MYELGVDMLPECKQFLEMFCPTNASYVHLLASIWHVLAAFQAFNGYRNRFLVISSLQGWRDWAKLESVSLVSIVQCAFYATMTVYDSPCLWKGLVLVRIEDFSYGSISILVWAVLEFDPTVQEPVASVLQDFRKVIVLYNRPSAEDFTSARLLTNFIESHNLDKPVL